MTIRTVRANETAREIRNYSFDLRDSKGRTIGAQVALWELDFVPQEEGAHFGWYNRPPGHYYAFRPWATRRSLGYGAMQATQYFRTIAERSDAVEKYLAGARKRALKLAA